MNDKDRIKKLEDTLSICMKDICRLCIRLNPQHKDCTQCDDMDDLKAVLNENNN